MKPEQLGVGQEDTRGLRLPDGLETVRESDIEKLVVSSSVRELGRFSFCQCRRLHEVVFEPGSQLERICGSCFVESGMRELVVPRSVRIIADMAFYSCEDLAALSFEEGSQLSYVGGLAFRGTQLKPETVRYPATLDDKMHGHEW